MVMAKNVENSPAREVCHPGGIVTIYQATESNGTVTACKLTSSDIQGHT